MLRIRGLKKGYKRLKVLTGLDMSLKKGDVYGFLGTNGCGKTTTMNILCNIIPKDEGDIEFDRDDVKIGYLPEAPKLYGYMNGFEYLDFIGACCRYEGDIKARTREVLEITGMLDRAKRPIDHYSRGMNQRVGIAAALYSKPDLLILDEPTSALDPAGRAEVMQIIEKLAVSGSTIILCTHILTDVERVANKIGILKDGVMAVEGTLREIREKIGIDNAINIRLRQYTDSAVSALGAIGLVSKFEAHDPTGVTLYAKEGVTERQLYDAVIAALNGNGILPEAVEFKRLTLEQIYISITGG